MLKTCAAGMGQAIPAAPATNPEDRRAQLETELAAADQRIAAYKEALQRPSQPQDSGAHRVLADLSDRLSAIHSAPDGIDVPGMAELEEKVDQCIQGLVVNRAGPLRLLEQCKDEYKSLQERNREFCPRAGGGSQESPQVPVVDAGARNILRGIQ